jgi:hypothetical protein
LKTTETKKEKTVFSIKKIIAEKEKEKQTHAQTNNNNNNNKRS